MMGSSSRSVKVAGAVYCCLVQNKRDNSDDEKQRGEQLGDCQYCFCYIRDQFCRGGDGKKVSRRARDCCEVLFLMMVHVSAQ